MILLSWINVNICIISKKQLHVIKKYSLLDIWHLGRSSLNVKGIKKTVSHSHPTSLTAKQMLVLKG